jgi:hypothetical protein
MQKHQNRSAPFASGAAAQGDAMWQCLLEAFNFYHGKDAVSVDM